VADWGTEPEKITEIAEKKHIFTHIEWHMRFYLIPCNKEPASFLWAEKEALRETYAIPAAFQLPSGCKLPDFL
jgi:A/G-specific adenine glycosylase